MKQLKKYVGILLVALCIIASLGGCSKKVKESEFATTAVAMFGDEPIYLDEVYFLTKISQVSYDYYYSIYGAWLLGQNATLKDWYSSVIPLFGGQNLTTWQVIQENVLSTIYQTRVLCSNAERLGVSLSDEDKEKINKAVKKFMEETETALLEASRATEELVTRIYTQNALANKVYDYISKDYDTTVDRTSDQFKTATATYFTVAKDDDDETDEKAKAEATLKAVQDAAAELEGKEPEEGEEEPAIDFAAIRTELNKNSEEEGVEVTLTQSANFSVSEKPSELETEVWKMKEGEISLIENDKNYYIIYLIDEDNEEAVQKKVDQELESRKLAKFEEEYKKLLENAPKLVVYDKIYEANIVFEEIDYPEVTTTVAPSTEKSTEGTDSSSDATEASGEESTEAAGDTTEVSGEESTEAPEDVTEDANAEDTEEVDDTTEDITEEVPEDVTEAGADEVTEGETATESDAE